MIEMTSFDLLRKISEYQFVTVELNLYLDTHPEDELARADYLYYSTRLMELMAAHEQNFGPLMNFGHSPTEAGDYVTAWPWEA
jgi:spore coat protein JB